MTAMQTPESETPTSAGEAPTPPGEAPTPAGEARTPPGEAPPTSTDETTSSRAPTARDELDAARGLFDLIDEATAATPPDGSVPREVIDAIVGAGLYGLMVPEAAGGQELALADLVDVYAEVSRADGSTGWVYFAADLTAAYFGAYLDDEGCQAVFGDHVPLMAGQFAPNGTAEADGAEWILQGDYQFGSGIALAEWAGGGVLATPASGGDPEYLFACFPADQAELRGNWDVLGLRATASYDYAVRDVRVPASLTFDFFAPTIHRGGGMYGLGILPLAAAGHAGWALGVSRRMLDELRAKAAGTHRMGHATALAESERFLHAYGDLETRWRAGKALVREVLEAAEAQSTRDGVVDEHHANLVRQACVHVNQGGADIAREAYLLAGTQALREGPMQRCFRDLHAGSQHFFAGPAATIDYARTLLTA